MKRKILLPMLLLCFVVNIFAQQAEKKARSPIENSKVTREFDENGNLIKYDSVYSYNWTGDTTLMNFKDMPNFFGDPFSLFSDSTFKGNSFFDDFDQLLSSPFRQQKDSLTSRKFGIHPKFDNFMQNNDSDSFAFPEFDQFFQNFKSAKNDSIPSGLKITRPKSMDEMMQMMQQQLKEMEEQHRKFFGN